HVALLGHGRAAHATADTDETVVGGRADVRAQAQHVVRKQLVDAGPVEVGVQLVHALDRALEHAFEWDALALQRVQLGDDLVDGHGYSSTMGRAAERLPLAGRPGTGHPAKGSALGGSGLTLAG